ncbi:unnamed protein product, partial [marine sediment metagenome]
IEWIQELPGSQEARETLWGPGGQMTDFIMRPGQKPMPFSPQDTIVGTKGGAGGGINITNHITVSAAINNDMDLRNLANRLSEYMDSELRRQTTY